MTKENAKSISLQEKFDLGTSRRREKLSRDERAALDEHSNRYKEALRRGNIYKNNETKVFGESPLPGGCGGGKKRGAVNGQGI